MDQPASVLTIEDDSAIRLSVAGYLGDRGYEVLQAEDGQIGLEMFRTRKPDLVLVDLRLPNVDGHQVLRTIKQESPDTPLLVVSGTGIIADAVEALHLGAWDYLLKPIEDMEILLHSVQTCLERARLIADRKNYQQHLEREVKARTAELEEANQALRNEIEVRTLAEQELARYKDHLEDLVDKRTKELEETHEKLYHSERLVSIGTLAAGIAHEINNPLGMMLLDVEEALMMIKDDDLGHVLLGIKENIQRCSRIVKSVLQFAKEEPSEKFVVDLNDLIKQTIDLKRSSANSRKVSLNADLDQSALSVMGDPTGLQQVFVNLIQNALDASEAGTAITLKSEFKNGKVLVSVSDQGCGMNEEQIKRAFEPFFTTRLWQGGTGLGLSIAHGIISDHQGTIHIESEVGKGTRMIVELPEA